MRHILLTWNPGRDNDEQWTPEEWDADMVTATSESNGYDGTWSVGNRVQGIEPGDRAYMLRQGTHGRGVVAIGEVTSLPFPDKSWRVDGGDAQYVHVTWWEAVPLDERLDIQELKAKIPEFKWDNVYSSGRDITSYGADLEQIWAGEASERSPLPPVVRGAGFGTAEQNRKVERAAIKHVKTAFRGEGYKVISVEQAHCGWDLTAIKGEEEIHIEVKGVAGPLVRFFLTANEHSTALSDPKWRLVVVTSALDDPGWYDLDGPTAASYALPALYQVRVPDEAFAD